MTESASEPPPRIGKIYVAAIVITLVAWGAMMFRGEPGPPVIRNERLSQMLPVVREMDRHSPNHECAECHEHNHATWADSYHSKMTQVITPETVLGDFNDVTIDIPSYGRTMKLTRREGLPWVSFSREPELAPASRVKRKDYPLVLSTGSHHLQFYWFPVGSERTLAILPLGHHIADDRWIPMADSFLSPPGRAFDTQTALWNSRCIRCHTTFADLNKTDEVLHYDSQVQEFGISCAACHGPAADHVAYQRNAKTPSPSFDTKIVDTIVNPATLPHQRSTQVCAACHTIYKAAHWRPHTPGQALGNDRRIIDPAKIRAQLAEYATAGDDPSMRDASAADLERERAASGSIVRGAFWPDGRPRVTGGDYNALLKTACHTKGEMSCVSCHRLHQDRKDTRPRKEWANDQLKAEALGDQACTQCHEAAAYASPKHTHHAAGSGGSSCYNCHMPYTSYGLLTAIRSHAIYSPSAAAYKATGRPDACNLCHLDKPLAWTADHLQKWYDIPGPDLDPEDREVALAAALALRGDAAQRALVAYALGWQPALEASNRDWIPPYLANLLKDPYSAVRYIAARSLKRQTGYESFEFDFVAEPSEHESRAAAALEQWRKRPAAPHTGLSAVLLDPRGKLQTERFEKLRDNRDDREINLVE